MDDIFIGYVFFFRKVNVVYEYCWDNFCGIVSRCGYDVVEVGVFFIDCYGKIVYLF